MGMVEGSLITHLQGNHGVGWGGQGQPPPHPWGGSDLSGLFPCSAHAPPATSGRMSGEGKQPYQPLVSICAPPHVICNCGPGDGQPELPPLP